MKDSWQRNKSIKYKRLIRKLRLLKEGKEDEKVIIKENNRNQSN